LTNGAALSGFTLQGGATLASYGDTVSSSGGGIWAASTNALVANCAINGNAAYVSGGGAVSGTLRNCWVEFNTTFCAGPSASVGGGGAFQANAFNSVIANNLALAYNGGTKAYGGGVYGGILNNCTILDNTAGDLSVPHNLDFGIGGGTYMATLKNCIAWNNSATLSDPNCFGGSLQYCCTTPLASGTGNFTNNPQLIADGFHLASTSPCRGAGTNDALTGTDIDGQPWNNPPSIGCDEWQPAPALFFQPTLGVTANPDALTISVGVVGQDPYACWWSKDGVLLQDDPHYALSSTTNLLVRGLGPLDTGAYQVVVSNAFGMTTSQVAQVTVHCVDASGASPAAPFTSWLTAATNIQDAIAAAVAGDVVLVTNGLYASGGKVMAGNLTNRVALDKALVVMSVNGWSRTIVQGAWDPATTNGPAAVRCAWLTNGAVLSGFTLQGGATRAAGDAASLQAGGGAVCPTWPLFATVANCLITGCAANYGGGICEGVANNCVLSANSSLLGGGSDSTALNNCLVNGNFALSLGGGVYLGSIANCTVVSNVCAGGGGGVMRPQSGSPFVMNSIIYFNSASSNANLMYGYSFGIWTPPVYCCTTPALTGIGDISADPQLLDGVHIAATSPCRGAGSALYSSGTDLDGEPWANPPSMGCDEVWETNITGSLSVSAAALWPAVAQGGAMPLSGQVSGRASRVGWSFGDGSLLTNASCFNTSYAWTNPGDYTVTFSAYNTDYPDGVSTNLTVQVLPLAPPPVWVGGFDGSNFSLSFPGQPGLTYVVEQTTNLAAPVLWQPVTSLFSTGSVLQVTDPQATNAAQFYRVRTQ
jgi:hypothetical protein